MATAIVTPAVTRERMLSKSEFGFYKSVDALTELKTRFHQYIEDRKQKCDFDYEVEEFEAEKQQWTKKIDAAIAEWDSNKGFKGPTYIETGIHAATRCGVTQKWTVALI